LINYKIRNSRGKEIKTDVSLHPGEVLEDELEVRSIAKNVFAGQLGMKASHFSGLLHGKRHVGASTALKLENILAIPAEYWMRIQVYYDLFAERQKQEKAA
jgi:addiction module HigA family antidote